jgi:hypothetical protein
VLAEANSGVAINEPLGSGSGGSTSRSISGRGCGVSSPHRTSPHCTLLFIVHCAERCSNVARPDGRDREYEESENSTMR